MGEKKGVQRAAKSARWDTRKKAALEAHAATSPGKKTAARKTISRGLKIDGRKKGKIKKAWGGVSSLEAIATIIITLVPGRKERGGKGITREPPVMRGLKKRRLN